MAGNNQLRAADSSDWSELAVGTLHSPPQTQLALIFTSIRKYQSLNFFFVLLTICSVVTAPVCSPLLSPLLTLFIGFLYLIYLRIFKISLLFDCCFLISHLAPQEICCSLQWLVYIYLLLPLQTAVKVFVRLCSPCVSILTVSVFFLRQVFSFSIIL